LGLATFASEKFALADALQYLGNVGFRDLVPAYKHSAAVFSAFTGTNRF
jgi:hypothetical protein